MKSVLILSAMLLAATALADDEKSKPVAQKRPAMETKRGVVVLAHAAAKDVAAVLAAHFKGDAEIHAGPESASNCILVYAPSYVFDEVVATIDRLDRRPHSIAVDVFIAELNAKKADAKSPDEKDFSGPSAEVVKRLDGMMKSGQLAGLKRFQLGAIEGQTASMSLGENKPYVMGVAGSARGMTTKQITYRNIGTQVRVTPRVSADGSITVELNLQDSRGRDSATASVGNDEKGVAIPAVDFISTSLTSKIMVPPGQAILAKDAKATSKEGQGETLIVVSARVTDSEPKAK